MKGKAGRVYSLTPKGEKAIEVTKKYLEELQKELSSVADSQTKRCSHGYYSHQNCSDATEAEKDEEAEASIERNTP